MSDLWNNPDTNCMDCKLKYFGGEQYYCKVNNKAIYCIANGIVDDSICENMTRGNKKRDPAAPLR